VRRKAIDVLAGIGTKTARAMFLNAFRDPDPSVRESAIGAAGALRMVEATPLLLPLLRDPVEAIALRAAGALGRVGQRNGFELAKRTLLRDGPNSRLAAQVVGDIVGHRFPANLEGIKAARRYLNIHESSLASS
jgi:HEAT repeat protein